MEVETHLLLALRLNYIENDVCAALLEQTAEVGRLLNGLANSLR